MKIMNKRKIIKSIYWRKSLFKRLLCKHEYKDYEIQDTLVQPLNEWCIKKYIICKKCGKYKGSY